MTGKTVTVERRKAWYGAARKVWVLVDGKRVDTLGVGDSVTMELPEGNETIVASLDWVKSKPVSAEELGDGAELEISNPHALLKLATAATIGMVLGAWVSGAIGMAWTNIAIVILAIVGAITFDPGHLRLSIRKARPR